MFATHSLLSVVCSDHTVLELKMEKNIKPPSDEINSSVNTIEASIEIVRKKRKRRRRCNAPAAEPISSPKSGRISLCSVRTLSIVKAMDSISKSSCVRMLSAAELKHEKKRTASISSTVGKRVSDKHSSLLFSGNSMGAMPEAPMFNRPQDANSLVSEAVFSDTFLSEYEKCLNSSQVNLQSEADREWEALSQQISPQNSDHNLQDLFSNMDIQYQSEVTFNQTIHSPIHESNFELSDYQSLAAGDVSCANDFRNSIEKLIATQNLSISLLTEQNHKISTQLQDLHSYVREKMEASEVYVKEKLTQIEEACWANVKLTTERNRRDDEINRKQQVSQPIRMQQVNEPNRSQRDKKFNRSQPNRIQRDIEPIGEQQDKVPNRIGRDNKVIEAQMVNEAIHVQPAKQLNSTKELVMPSIPILRDFSLVILDIALKDDNYMKQFVSEVSRIVTLNAYNCRNSVRSVINELFSINLLGKYRWSTRTFSSDNKPTFSSFTNIMRAIARVLTNYMSEYEVRREVKAFFKDML